MVLLERRSRDPAGEEGQGKFNSLLSFLVPGATTQAAISPCRMKERQNTCHGCLHRGLDHTGHFELVSQFFRKFSLIFLLVIHRHIKKTITQWEGYSSSKLSLKRPA